MVLSRKSSGCRPTYDIMTYVVQYSVITLKVKVITKYYKKDSREIQCLHVKLNCEAYMRSVMKEIG